MFAYLEEEGITVTAEVVAVPTRTKPRYRLKLPDDTYIYVAAECMWDENDHPNMDAEYDPSNVGDDPLPPSWICDGQGITWKADGGYKRGTLDHDAQSQLDPSSVCGGYW